jgi:hypothetical protein
MDSGLWGWYLVHFPRHSWSRSGQDGPLAIRFGVLLRYRNRCFPRSVKLGFLRFGFSLTVLLFRTESPRYTSGEAVH